MIIVGPDEKFIFTATDRGYGKKTASDMYPIKHCGGQGPQSPHHAQDRSRFGHRRDQ